MPLPMRQELNPLGTMDVVQVKAAPDTGINPVDQTANKERALNAQAVGGLLGNWAQQFNKEGSEAAFLDGVRQEALIGANAEANRELQEPNLWKDAFGKGVQKTAAALMPQRTDERVAGMAQAALASDTPPDVFAQQAQKHIETELARFKDMPEVDPNILIHVASRGMASLEQGIKGYSTAFSKKQEAMQTAGVVREHTTSLKALSELVNTPDAFGKQFGSDYFKTIQNTSYMKPDKVEQLSAYYLDQVANVIENAPGSYDNRLKVYEQYMGLIKELPAELQGKVDPSIKRIGASIQKWNEFSIDAGLANADAVVGAGSNPIPVLQQLTFFKDVKGANTIVDYANAIRDAVPTGKITPAAASQAITKLFSLQEKMQQPIADKPLEIFAAAVPGDGSIFASNVVPANVQALASTPQGRDRIWSEIQDATSRGKLLGPQAQGVIPNYGLNTTLAIMEQQLPKAFLASPEWGMIKGKVVDDEFTKMKASLSDPNTLVNNGGYLTWVHTQLQNPAISAQIPDTPLNNQVRAVLTAAASDPKIQAMPVGNQEQINAKHLAFSKAVAERWVADKASTSGLYNPVDKEYVLKSAEGIANKQAWYYLGMGRGSASDKKATAGSMSVLTQEYFTEQTAAGKQLSRDDVDNVNARMQVRTDVGIVLLPPRMIDTLGVSGSDEKVVTAFSKFAQQGLGLDEEGLASLKNGKLIQRLPGGVMKILEAKVVTDVNTKQYVLQTKEPDAIGWRTQTIGSMQKFQEFASAEFQKEANAYTATSYTKQGTNGPVQVTVAAGTKNRDALLYTPANVSLPFGADSASQVKLLTQYEQSVSPQVQASSTALANTLKRQGISDNLWNSYDQRLQSIGLMLHTKGVKPAEAGVLLKNLQDSIVKSWSSKTTQEQGLIQGKPSQDVLNALSHSPTIGERPALRNWYRQQVDALDLIVRTHRASKLK